MKILVILILCQVVGSGFTLNYKNISEYFKCDEFVVDPELKEEWLGNVPVWYTSLWSKVEIYRHAQDLLSPPEFSALTEQGLAGMCLYYKQNGENVTSYGFGGRTMHYEAFPDPIRKGYTYWAIRGKNGEREYLATSYITKTDNKSYFVEATVWSNKMKGFNVGSNVKKLDKGTYKEIAKHLIDIGFKPKNFFKVNYEKCPPPPF